MQQNRVNLLNANATRTNRKRSTGTGGQNSKGSQKKPKFDSSWDLGDRGHFQYGLGQYGFINPQGVINWSADAGKAGKASLLGFGNVQAQAKRSGQIAKMPIQKELPPAYMTAPFQQRKSDLNRDYNLGLSDASYADARNEEDYHLALNAISDAFAKLLPGLSSSIAGSGFDPSEGAGIGQVNLVADDRDRQVDDLRRQRERQGGDLGRFRERALGDLQHAEAINEREAKAAWLAANPGAARVPKLKKGFSTDKKGNTLYTNKLGVRVSAERGKGKTSKKKKGK